MVVTQGCPRKPLPPRLCHLTTIEAHHLAVPARHRSASAWGTVCYGIRWVSSGQLVNNCHRCLSCSRKRDRQPSQRKPLLLIPSFTPALWLQAA
eukprot:scaffold37008_cov16-Tisochrysis_lutea.AAC.1